MGTLRLLHGHFIGIKEAPYPPEGGRSIATNQGGKVRRGLRQRELKGFDEKVGKFDEIGEKDEKRRKMSVFNWTVYK